MLKWYITSFSFIIFANFRTHKKVLDRQCQQLESSVLAGREPEKCLRELEPTRPMQAGVTSCESKIKSHVEQPSVLCSRILAGPSNRTRQMAPPLDRIHPLASRWPPGISRVPVSKQFLNTFQVIQLSPPTLLDKDRSLKTWKFTWEERRHTHFARAGMHEFLFLYSHWGWIIMFY